MTDNSESTPETKPKPTSKAKGANSVSETPQPSVKYEAPRATAVVGNGETDDVLLSAIRYKNMARQKSLSVHHLQRRLNDKGYTEAYADKDGFYGDLTRDGVTRYQEENNLDATGIVDWATLEKLFEGDPNVTIMP